MAFPFTPDTKSTERERIAADTGRNLAALDGGMPARPWAEFVALQHGQDWQLATHWAIVHAAEPFSASYIALALYLTRRTSPPTTGGLL